MLNTSLEIRQVISAEIARLLDEAGRPVPAIEDGCILTDDLSLDSLALASLFIALEDRFGVDPFSDKFDIVDMRTVADLNRAYSDTVGVLQLA